MIVELLKPTFKPKCPNCSAYMVKAGFHTQKKKGKLQRYKCQNCGTIRLAENKCFNCGVIKFD